MLQVDAAMKVDTTATVAVAATVSAEAIFEAATFVAAVSCSDSKEITIAE